MSRSEELSEPDITVFFMEASSCRHLHYQENGVGVGELKISSFNHGFVFPVTSPHPGAYAELLY